MTLVPCIVVFGVIAILLCEVMDTDDNAFPGYSRKRMKKEKTWKKVEAKKKRNSGEKYVSRHKNAMVPSRQIGEPCSCQCFSKIGQDNVQQIFNAFWELGNYDLQNSHLSKLVINNDVKRSYLRGTFVLYGVLTTLY
ncbi:hypothetical protein AVEN_203274-1 [Araneus ventricosus]|uniref:Uncharacterized protein n=1 Tax=Araneus ventricosus TaxID=182803 RepID=A0A4Y2I382_ARAVE|nr:hypothetical protein AVEN_203274-1 [Araneus ventricosus]